MRFRCRIILKSFLIFSLLFLVACGETPLYHDLSETDANEILVALQERKIEAQKVKEEKSQQVTWMIVTQGKDASQARKVLIELNLPRKKNLSLKDVCKDALIPTPEQEKCKKLLGLKGEIVNSLERIPGVIDADVVLNVPEVSEFNTDTQSQKRPTASAVIRVRGNPEGMELTESKLQRFIANTVENLDPRDVSVIIKYVKPPEEVIASVKEGTPSNLVKIAGLQMDEPSRSKFKIYALGALVLILLLAAAIVLLILQLVKLRKGNSTGGDSTDGGDFLPSPENPQIPPAGQTSA